MRLVLDTSILVAAFRSRTGASRLLLESVARGEIRLVASSALFLEYEAVLTRAEQVASHGVSPENVERFLIAMATFTDHVRIHYRYRPQLQDANDEMVLEAAINGRAEAVVTHNVKDFLPAAKRFGIAVLTPGSILREWGKR